MQKRTWAPAFAGATIPHATPTPSAPPRSRSRDPSCASLATPLPAHDAEPIIAQPYTHRFGPAQPARAPRLTAPHPAVVVLVERSTKYAPRCNRTLDAGSPDPDGDEALLGEGLRLDQH